MRLQYLLSIALVCVLSFGASAQGKTYGQVYYSVKNGDAWGGLIKTTFGVTITSIDEGFYQLVMTGTENTVTIKFEATTSEGRAFHAVSKAHPIKWKGPEGQTTIAWVYANKNIADIFNSATLKPWDLEIQFSEGPAVKYYMSPKY